MGKMTNKMVEKSFEIGKERFLDKISLQEGVDLLVKIGVNENSARDYIYLYSHLRNGEEFKRRANNFATEYYLQRIFNEGGISHLQKALLSLTKHFDYWEKYSGTRIKKGRDIYEKFLKMINGLKYEIVYPDEVDSDQHYLEGKSKKVSVNIYERNPKARKDCIKFYGFICQICEFDFEKKYGELGKKFIHVHHKLDIAEIGQEYQVDPIKDLIPVCPNCHSMLHKRKPAFSIEELKELIN